MLLVQGALREEATGDDVATGGSSGLESDHATQNRETEEEHQEPVQGEDGEREFETLRLGVPGVKETGPPGEPIVMYPSLIAARREYISTDQVKHAFEDQHQ